MKKRWQSLLYTHIFLLLWAVLFLLSLFLADGGTVASMLAPGNFAFLFVNIPLAVLSVYHALKGHLGKPHIVPVLMLSLLNTLIGIAAWIFVVMLMLKP